MPESIAARIVRAAGEPHVLDLLVNRLAGAELTSVLLEVLRRRADGVTPSEVLNRASSDRFVLTSPIELRAIRRAEDCLLAAVPDHFEQVMLSPLVPFGTHRMLGGTPQDIVVSTIRRTEVAADPTAGLALEAAIRRRTLLAASPRSSQTVELATIQRVTRGQTFDGSRSFAHFGLLGLVTAGRDCGNLSFEKQAVVQHARILAAACLGAGAPAVSVALTDFSGEMGDVIHAAAAELGATADVSASVDSERTHARGYYPSVCFKVHAHLDGEAFEYGDGGLVDWGGRLLGNAKERMMISGLSVDRVALDLTAP